MDNLFSIGLDKDQSDEEDSAVVEEEVLTIKYDTYHRLNEKQPTPLALALVSKHHSLWAEFIYNAARVLADLIDGNSIDAIAPIDVQNKKCLELGAGAGLPAIIAAINGASEVVVSDYGHDFDLSLIYPLDINCQLDIITGTRCKAVGYTWGYPVQILLQPDKYYQSPSISIDTTSYYNYKKTKLQARYSEEHLSRYSAEEVEADQNNESNKFDLIFAADLLFNRSEHRKLLWTIKHCLKKDTGVCYITFSHHDPAKAALDLNFFTLAVDPEYAFTVEKLGTQSRPSYPFREQDGKDEIRGIIHIYTLKLLS
eukprot:gene474-507_t